MVNKERKLIDEILLIYLTDCHILLKSECGHAYIYIYVIVASVSTIV
jgi:hypothetical protein